MTMVILLITHDNIDRDIDISCGNHEHAINQIQNHDRNIPTIHNDDNCNGRDDTQDKNDSGDTSERNGEHIKW